GHRVLAASSTDDFEFRTHFKTDIGSKHKAAKGRYALLEWCNVFLPSFLLVALNSFMQQPRSICLTRYPFKFLFGAGQFRTRGIEVFLTPLTPNSFECTF